MSSQSRDARQFITRTCPYNAKKVSTNGHSDELLVITKFVRGITSRAVFLFLFSYRLFFLSEPSASLFHCRLLEYSEEIKKALEGRG